MVSRFDKYVNELEELSSPVPNALILIFDPTETDPANRTKFYRFSRLGAQNLTHGQIGDIAFSNPPTTLTDEEKEAVRAAIGAGTSSQDLSDAEIGDKAFSNPPPDLETEEQENARLAIQAASVELAAELLKLGESNLALIELLQKNKLEAFSQGRELGLLLMRLDPPLVHITAEHGEQIAAFQDTFSIHFANPEVLTGDIWYDIKLDDVPMHDNRIKWTTTTHEVSFTPTNDQARRIVENLNLGDTRVELTFYNLAEADTSIPNPPSDVVEVIQLPLGVVKDLTDAEIGDKAFSNPPSDLEDTEKFDARKAIDIDGKLSFMHDTIISNTSVSADFAYQNVGFIELGDTNSVDVQLFDIVAYGEARTAVDRDPFIADLLISVSSTIHNNHGDHINVAISLDPIHVINAEPADYVKNAWLLGNLDNNRTNITIRAGRRERLFIFAGLQGQASIRNIRLFVRQISIPTIP